MVFDEEPKQYAENWDHLIHISIENLGLFSSYHETRQYIMFMTSYFHLKTWSVYWAHNLIFDAHFNVTNLPHCFLNLEIHIKGKNTNLIQTHFSGLVSIRFDQPLPSELL